MRISEKTLDTTAKALRHPVTSIFIDRSACVGRVRIYEDADNTTRQALRARTVYFKTNKEAYEYLMERLYREYENEWQEDVVSGCPIHGRIVGNGDCPKC
jgi:hypothetical protein